LTGSRDIWRDLAPAIPAFLLLVGGFVLPVGLLLSTALSDPSTIAVHAIASATAGTIGISAASALLATLTGLAVAAAAGRVGERMRGWVLTASALPLSLSSLATAFAFVLLFGRSGTATLWLADAGFDPRRLAALFYGPAGLILVYTYILTPRALLSIAPVVMELDMAVFRAARSLGAGPMRAAWDALVPQVAPAFIAALSLCFAVAAGSYAAAFIILGTKAPLLAVLLVAQLGDSATNLGGAALIAVCLVALCVTASAVAHSFSPRRAT